MRRLLMCLSLISAALIAQDRKGDPQNGKRLYLKNGCYQCHGQSGQGGLAGARLAQTPRTQASFIGYVRNPSPGGMPPYRTQVMSDQELADVWAYIKSLPEPPSAKSIPLLSQ